jgi:hypothetical protein
MKAYVQTVAGYFSCSGSAAARQGFEELGYEVVGFSYQELKAEELLLRPDRPLNGGIETMQECFRQMGVICPGALDYPDSLKNFLGRDIRFGTMRDIRNMDSFKDPVFIKPVEHKLFNGALLQGKRADNLINFVHIADDVKIQISEVVEFISEWRFYILDKKVVGVGHYGFGNPLIFPDGDIVQAIIDRYHDAPISYGLDVGITSDDRVLLVEINDSLSLGNYGCRPKPYARMIGARWFEVLGMQEKMKEFL